MTDPDGPNFTAAEAKILAVFETLGIDRSEWRCMPRQPLFDYSWYRGKRDQNGDLIHRDDYRE